MPIDLPAPEVTVASFAEGLGKTWEAGERRTIHRRPYVRRQPAARRPSMLEGWLAAGPHITAAIVDRLREATPGRFGEKQPRTLQRFVTSWRAKTAQLLIGTEAMIAIETPAVVPAGTAASACATIADGALGNIAS